MQTWPSGAKRTHPGLCSNMNIWYWTEWVAISWSRGKLCEVLLDIVEENVRPLR